MRQKYCLHLLPIAIVIKIVVFICLSEQYKNYCSVSRVSLEVLTPTCGWVMLFGDVSGDVNPIMRPGALCRWSAACPSCVRCSRR